ncbi:MAG TPA: hypothetical protein DCQ42_09480 [Halomonas sp.]|nr:hypothetical protein [Halomonas sp.]
MYPIRLPHITKMVVYDKFIYSYILYIQARDGVCKTINVRLLRTFLLVLRFQRGYRAMPTWT